MTLIRAPPFETAARWSLFLCESEQWYRHAKQLQFTLQCPPVDRAELLF